MTTRRVVEVLLAAGLTLAAVVYVAVLRSAPAPGGAAVTAGRSAAAAEPAPRRPLRIGWTAWADAEWVTHLVERILEQRLHQPVQLVMADIGLQYQGLVDGDIDAMLMAWLPVTHADYYQKVAGKVIDLGPIYTHARLGWAVPAYVPREEVASLADLRKPEVRERMGGRIQGIDPGSGLMRASRRAVKTYGLSRWKLVPASSAAMAAALERAIRSDEWTVVTAWSPHWIFARFDLRYLDDPLGVLGHSERVHALAREGFGRDFPPEVVDFFSRLFVPIGDVEQALLVANEDSVDAAVDDFLTRHADLVDYWVTGEPPQSPAVQRSAAPAAGPTPADRRRGSS